MKSKTALWNLFVTVETLYIKSEDIYFKGKLSNPIIDSYSCQTSNICEPWCCYHLFKAVEPNHMIDYGTMR